MIRWKKLVGITMACCMLGIVPAQAAVVIPPIPTAGTGDTAQTSNQGPGVETTASQENQGPGVETTASQENQGPGTHGTTTKAKAAEITRPEIHAEGALLMDAATGTVLYEKNGDTKYYPASITKLMTALLVLENCNLEDTVTFSAAATTNLESGAVSLSIVEGDKLTVNQSLHALLLKSANEVANGLAEHVSGSVEAFAAKMNEKAKALGCTNTNFVNPHGLNNSDHRTTPKDMALIARAAFQNETLCQIATTLSYKIPATKKAEARTITMGHKMMYQTDARYYPGIIGGKTGYTSLAGNTLVTGAQRDGVRLIAVIMKSKSTHYTDTKALLDYGFEVMAASKDSGPPPGPASASAAGWRQDDTGWYYIKANGAKASNEWQTIGGEEYWFDSNAYMATGWRQFSNGDWYYFRSSGAMAKNYWVEDNGKYFYLDASGVMLKNATTPDGYRVDGQGVWVQ